MQEEAAGGGTGRAGSGSLKRSLDSRAPKAARQERWSADSAREGGAAGVALTSAPAAALKLGSSLPGAPLAQGPPAAAALAASERGVEAAKQCSGKARSRGRSRGRSGSSGGGKHGKARRHSTARTGGALGSVRPRRPWCAAPPPFAAPAFRPAPLRAPCLSQRGRYFVTAFRQEMAGDAAVPASDAPALLAEYAAELAQEEEFAHAATPAAYPRLNARGRQYVAAFRRELLAWGRQRLAGTDPEELVAEYAGGLELEAPFSVAPAAAVGAAGPCGGDSGD